MFHLKTARFAFAFVLVASLLILAAPVVHADGLASQPEATGIQQLTGSWSGTTDLGSSFLLSFDNSKTYTVTFSLPDVGAGHGHGAWQRDGLKTFSLTDITYILNPNDGSIALVQKTQGTVTVNGDQADFDLLVSLSLPDGTPVAAIPAGGTAERIVVEPIP